MPFSTTPERIGIKKGMLQMIEDALRVKFGEEGAELMSEIRSLEDAEKFRVIIQAVFTAATLDEVRRACAEAAAPPPPPKKKASKRMEP